MNPSPNRLPGFVERPAGLEGRPVVYEAAKMISDLVDVQIGQRTAKISASSPFLGPVAWVEPEPNFGSFEDVFPRGSPNR